jgi:hypothetical protein
MGTLLQYETKTAFDKPATDPTTADAFDASVAT